MTLALILLSTYFFLMTPVLNSYIRVGEAEADLFGINASGQPDGEAVTDLKLGEYRKLDPTPFEEILFFDHPSGRNHWSYAASFRTLRLRDSTVSRRD